MKYEITNKGQLVIINPDAIFKTKEYKRIEKAIDRLSKK